MDAGSAETSIRLYSLSIGPHLPSHVDDNIPLRDVSSDIATPLTLTSGQQRTFNLQWTEPALDETDVCGAEAWLGLYDSYRDGVYLTSFRLGDGPDETSCR